MKGRIIFLILNLVFYSFLSVSDLLWAEDGRARAESLYKESIRLEREGDEEKAMEVIGEALKADPNYANTHVQMGYLLLKRNKLDEAMNHFKTAIKLNPRSHDAKTGMGIILSRKGDLKGAEAILKEALITNPDPVRTHYELGMVYEKFGDLEKAINEYKMAIKKYRQGRR